MRPNSPKLGLFFVLVCLGAVIPAFAQQVTGLPEDWSHRHLIFSDPGSFREAVQGDMIEKWLAVTSNPRFVQQQARRSSQPSRLRAQAIAAKGEATAESRSDAVDLEDQIGYFPQQARPRPNEPQGDWSYFLGNTAASAGQNNYPAKFDFDVTTAPSCANDYVVFGLNQAGAAGQPSIVAFNNLYSGPAVAASATGTFTAEPNTGDTVTIINGVNILILTAGAVNSGTTFRRSGTLATDATNLAAAINRVGNGSSVSVSATSAGAVVTVTATATGFAGNSIKVQQSMTGFTWSSTNLVGGTDVGICGAGAPTVMFAYRSAATAVTTSPVLSIDGTKIAFVELGTAGAILHVLRWKAGEGTVAVPVNPTTSTNIGATYQTCLAGATSCEFKLTYSTNNNTRSSPFYDYSGTNDALFVGDNGGILWKIVGVFNGTPAVAGGGWAAGITVSAGTTLTSPVLDSVSHNIFVNDSNGKVWYVRDATSTTGTCASGSPPCLGTPNGDANNGQAVQALVDGPIVDSSAGTVFTFSWGKSAGTAVVDQFNTALGNKVVANVSAAGGGSGIDQVHPGAFDNAYFATGPGSGHLYVCGNPGTSVSPILYSITFNASGIMTAGNATAGPGLGTTGGAHSECSPITEFFNTATNTDWLFMGYTGTCPNGTKGCLMAFDVTAGPPAAGTLPASTAAETGGTSAIVVDNASSSGQASSLYFTTLGAATCGTAGGGNVSACAVKRTQSGLQ